MGGPRFLASLVWAHASHATLLVVPCLCLVCVFRRVAAENPSQTLADTNRLLVSVSVY